jgi:hypothetical protein
VTNEQHQPLDEAACEALKAALNVALSEQGQQAIG